MYTSDNNVFKIEHLKMNFNLVIVLRYVYLYSKCHLIHFEILFGYIKMKIDQIMNFSNLIIKNIDWT